MIDEGIMLMPPGDGGSSPPGSFSSSGVRSVPLPGRDKAIPIADAIGNVLGRKCERAEGIYTYKSYRDSEV